MEGLEPEPGVSWGFSYTQWLSPPYQGGFGSQVAGAKALRVGSELVLFPLSVKQWHLQPSPCITVPARGRDDMVRV